MKIAIFTDAFLPQVNGVVTATLNLAKGLADKGHKIYIVAPKYPKLKEFRYPNIKIIRIPSIPAIFYPEFKLNIPLRLQLLIYLKKEKIDLIHFQTPWTIGLQGIFLAKMMNIPLVATFHTMIAHPQYLKHIKFNSGFIQKAAWFYVRLFYNRCDLISSPSESTKKELEENRLSNIKVISNGIDETVFNNKNSKKEKLKYNPNGPLLLFIGRIAHEKNILYLIDCFNLILKKVQNAKLVIAGNGPQMQDVKERVKKLGIEDKIILLGQVEHHKLIKSGIFKASDAFITASVTENQPMTILEAQINGMVCFGINKKGMNDLIINGVNGFLSELGDKQEFADNVSKVLKNKALLAKMKKNTVKLVSAHKLSNIIKIWEREYSKLIKK